MYVCMYIYIYSNRYIYIRTLTEAVAPESLHLLPQSSQQPLD